MLGTLHHFDPADAVAHADMPELERLMLHELAKRATIVRQAYAEFDYKTVVATLAAFMNTELSAFYFDIRKDALYCDPPSSVTRKAALTAIDTICDAILRWLAPVLSFTSEEAWRMYRPDAEPSVHLTLFPEGFDEFRDDALAAKWQTIRDVRRVGHRRARTRTRRQEHRFVAGGFAAGLCVGQGHLQHAVRSRSGRSLHHVERDGDQ